MTILSIALSTYDLARVHAPTTPRAQLIGYFWVQRFSSCWRFVWTIRLYSRFAPGSATGCVLTRAQRLYDLARVNAPTTPRVRLIWHFGGATILLVLEVGLDH